MKKEDAERIYSILEEVRVKCSSLFRFDVTITEGDDMDDPNRYDVNIIAKRGSLPTALIKRAASIAIEEDLRIIASPGFDLKVSLCLS